MNPGEAGGMLGTPSMTSTFHEFHRNPADEYGHAIIHSSGISKHRHCCAAGFLRFIGGGGFNCHRRDLLSNGWRVLLHDPSIR